MEGILDSLNITLSGGLGVFITTFLLVFLAEMGDKTQLIIIGFTTRYKLRQVIIGVLLSLVLLNVLAVLMGSLITTIIPMNYIQLIASLAFIIFGLMAFRKEKEEEASKMLKISPTLTVAVSFFIAELGDKTQLATMAFAAQYRMPLQVFLGAILAMIITDGMGLVAGVALNKYIPQRYIRIVSGLMFIGFGIFGIVSLMPVNQLTSIMQSTSFVIGVGALIIIFLLYFASSKPKKAK